MGVSKMTALSKFSMPVNYFELSQEDKNNAKYYIIEKLINATDKGMIGSREYKIKMIESIIEESIDVYLFEENYLLVGFYWDIKKTFDSIIEERKQMK